MDTTSPLRGEPRAAGGRLRALARPVGDFAVEIRGVDVRELGPADGAELRDVVYERKLVVLRGQAIDERAHIAFARVLGEPQIYFQKNYHHPDHPEIFVSSNVPMNGKKVGVANTGAYWHTDYQFFPQPLPLTTVRPIGIPTSGRGTYFVDMQRAYEELPQDLRALVDGRRAIHEAKWRYKIQPSDVDRSITEILEEFGAETPTVTHPAVMTHPVTGRKCLYVSRGFTVGLEGLDPAASRAALQRLFAHTERPERAHAHPWSEGDLLVWDNRQLVHMAKGGAPGEPSVSHRVGVYDGVPFCADEPEGRLLA
ncbi:MAG: TauD/TfdA family dioxygenase [Planctomycetota bacterium]